MKFLLLLLALLPTTAYGWFCIFGFGLGCKGGGPWEITLDFDGVPILSQGTFDSAGGKWEGTITADVADVDGSQLDPSFFSCPVPGTIDDLFICASVANLGPGILGQAGPIYSRTADNTAVAGIMRFDNSALSRPDFNDIVVS